MALLFLGIRHHGPGSARRLRQALREWHPDCLLVELPHDTEEALGFAGREELKPPVALLVYQPKDLSQTAFLPFAEFSPEWQALRYAIRHQVPLRPIDLPMSQAFALDQEASDHRLWLPATADEEQRRLVGDPLGFLAELAGYSDSERWWEVTFEQEEAGTDIFVAIQEMIRTLRETLNRPESTETLLREAYMRRQIRQAREEGFQRIAVVCGAWHLPALADLDRIKPAADNQRLRGLKKLKTAVTWIPWTYDRLARQSGYGAGVTAPAWYDVLFRQRGEATIRWMSRAARLLRKEGWEGSPAQALEAVRLAETLAGLRGRSIPGLDELEEAAQSVLAQGDPRRLALIRDRLIIGDVMGKVPPSIPVVPLQRDLEQAIRTARLSRESQTTESISKELDLRVDSNRAASLLLHRLLILDIPWGKLRKGSPFKLGNFSEQWTLKWKPDFAIRIIEASSMGPTLEEASTNALLRRAAGQEDLSGLTTLIGQALRAGLPRAVDPLVLTLRSRAALSRDILHLLDALPPLAHLFTYGDTRQTDTESVGQLIDELIPRICIGLPAAAMALDDEPAGLLFEQVLAAHHSFGLLHREDHLHSWEIALQQMQERPGVHELLKGGAARLLFDRSFWSVEQTASHLSLALGPDPSAAKWLEGFLHGSGLLLLHHPPLWQILDEWMGRLPDERFRETLPVLRRIFSRYPASERRQMLDLANNQAQQTQLAQEDVFSPSRKEKVLPVVKRLLILPEEEPGNR